MIGKDRSTLSAMCLVAGGLLVGGFGLVAVPEDVSAARFTDTFMPETCGGFANTGSNPFMVLEPGFQLVLEGMEDRKAVVVTITVQPETRDVDVGPPIGVVTTRVVQELETKGGILVEVSRNFFAICNRTNSVFYFGEDVDIFDETGTTVVSHEGAWLAGANGARAGIIMPGTVLLGARHFQEVAPGVAMDRAGVMSLSEVVVTPAGTFSDCLKTVETTPLDRGAKGFKFYAPGVGLVRDGAVRLTGVTDPRTAQQQ